MPPVIEVPGVARERARRRAPTPWFVPSPAHVGSWLAHPLLIGLLALLVGTTVSAGLVWHSDRFRLSGAHVMGNARLPAESIFAASGLAGRHVFSVRRHRAAARIEALPDVREASVRITLPAEVVITVVETEPRLLWNTAAGRMAIDENSYAVFPPEDRQGLVLVTDEVGLVASTGQRLPDSILESALAYGKHFEDLAYRRDAGFVGHTEAGVEVRLGTDGRLATRQLANLAALETHLAGQSARVAYIDVRIVGRPFYHLQQGAE
jgi:cell division septal protein FtsQ